MRADDFPKYGYPCGVVVGLSFGYSIFDTQVPGLTNLAMAGSGALARLEGPALDWLNGLWPSQWVGYIWLFVFGAGCILFSLLL
jgi:hypothetical protein